MAFLGHHRYRQGIPSIISEPLGYASEKVTCSYLISSDNGTLSKGNRKVIGLVTQWMINEYIPILRTSLGILLKGIIEL